MQRTILVADDEKSNLQVIVQCISLAQEDYSVVCAPNGKVACELAARLMPDLILMDWEMPEMNGLDALKYLKADERTKYIPVLMVTAFASSHELNIAFAAGAVDYVRKPVDAIELIARIKSVINTSEQLKGLRNEIEALKKR